MPTQTLRRLERDPKVEAIEADVQQPPIDPPPTAAAPVEEPAQVVGNGVRRIGGLQSPTAKIDGIDLRVNPVPVATTEP